MSHRSACASVRLLSTVADMSVASTAVRESAKQQNGWLRRGNCVPSVLHQGSMTVSKPNTFVLAFVVGP